MRRPERLAKVTVGVAAAALLALAWALMTAQGDTFWTLANGRLLLERGLVDSDPFTFTATAVPSTVRMPLTYALLAAVEQVTGLSGLLLVSAAIKTAALLLLWFGAVPKPARALCFPLLLGTLVLERADLCPRGQVLGDLWFALMLVLVHRLRTSDAGELTPRRRILTLLGWSGLGALWINSHPSALLGLVLMPMAALVARFEPQGSGRRLAGPLALRAGALALGATVTPYGPGLLLDGLELFEESSRAIVLFQSPDFADPGVLALFLAAALTLAWGVRESDRLPPSAMVWTLTLAALALTGRRYVPVLSMLVVAQLGMLVDGRERWRAVMASRGAWVVALALAVPVVVAGVLTRKDPLGAQPVRGARFIDEQRLPARVYHPYRWGGYLEYAWGPTGRVFIDGRNYLFGESGVAHDYLTIARGAPTMSRLLDTYQIRTVLWDPGTPLDHALARDPRWSVVLRTPREVVYTRR